MSYTDQIMMHEAKRRAEDRAHSTQLIVATWLLVFASLALIVKVAVY